MSAPGDARKAALKLPLAQGAVTHVAQIGRWPRFPFPRTELSHSFRDGYAERGVSVQYGDADLELGDLTVEVPRHKALPQQLHTVALMM